MGIDKSELFRDGDVYYMRLSEDKWIGVSHNGHDPKVVSKPSGKRLILYPEEGWSDPPIEVQQRLKVAALVAKEVSETPPSGSKKNVESRKEAPLVRKSA